MPDNQMPDFSSIAHGLQDDLVTYAAVTGLNFFKESFDKQGFTNEVLEPWPQRKTGEDGRGILMSTAHLRDSNQVLERSRDQIVFGNTAKYASIHNEGGVISIRVSARARKFFWYMFKATDKVKWKYMALTKKERLSITIPKRQFMGESKTLMNDIDAWVINQIITRFNNL
jgi:phage gpG-like protein